MNKIRFLAAFVLLALTCTLQRAEAQLYPTCTINIAAGQANPAAAGTPVLYTVVFNHAITPASFTVADVSTAGSTASGVTVNSITQVAPNDGTTFQVSISSTGAGAILASIPASVYSSTTTALVTSNVRLQSANASTYGMCMDASNNFYSVWTSGVALAKTTSAGVVSTFLSPGSPPNIVAMHGTDIYYHTAGSLTIGKVTTGGTNTASWGTLSSLATSNNNNMVFDAAGNLYTVCGSRISKTPAGGSGTGTQLNLIAAHALLVDASNNLLAVVAGVLYNIDKVTANTKTSIGTGANGTALGMYQDPFGNIYATTDAASGDNLFMWTPAGGPVAASWTLPSKSYTITGDAGGAVYVACGTPSNLLYRITPDGATNSYAYTGTQNLYSVFANTGNTPASSTYYTFDYNGTNNGDITQYVLAQTAGITDPANYGNLASTSTNNTVTISSVGLCITGGNGTESVAYTNNVGTGTSGNAIDADMTSGSAGAALNVPFLAGSATLSINFGKTVNPGDSIYVVLGQASGFNLSLFNSFTATAYAQANDGTKAVPTGATVVGSNSASGYVSLIFIGGVAYQTLTIGIDPTSTTGANSISIVASAFGSLGYTVNVYGVTVVPGLPTAINQTICFPGSITTLQAQKYTLAGSTIDMQWYKANDTTSANLVQTDATKSGQPYTSNYTTPSSVTATTNFYVRQSTSGCSLYSPLVPVTVTVLPVATPALVTNTSLGLTTCGSDGTGYISFVDPANPTNKYMSINPNGNTGYNFTSATAIEDAIILPAFTATSSTAIGQRLYSIVDGGTPPYTANGGMKVRIYYLPSDTTTARSLVHSVTGGVLSSSWFKVPGVATLASGLSSLLTATGVTGAIGLNSVATYGTEGTQKYVEFSGIQGFSTFGFAASKGLNAVLPVSGLRLTGQMANGFPHLAWTTITETNSSYFSIQSRLDGSSFTDIGKVVAAGSSTSLISYNYSDKTATGTVIYYRIKAVDIDGTASYSNIVAVDFSGTGRVLSVYPNPVTNLVNIETGVSGTYIAEIFTVDGKKITATQLSTASGLITLNIDRANIPSGVYLLKITSKTGTTSTYNTIIIK